MLLYASAELILVPRHWLVMILEIYFQVGDGQFLQSPRTPTQLSPFIWICGGIWSGAGIHDVSITAVYERKNKQFLAESR